MNDLMEYDMLFDLELHNYRPDNSDKCKPLTDNEGNSAWIKKEANE